MDNSRGKNERLAGCELGVSVVVPAFNAEETLGRSLQSVLEQTIPDWELIIVDDGSDDETSAVARGFAARDGRIQLVTQSHHGVSAARNAGIEKARMPWLLFLDADDRIHPSFLQIMTQRLWSEPELDAVYCRWRNIGCQHELVKPASLAQGDLHAALASRCIFAIHTCVIRRSLVQRAGGFDKSFAICEDWDLWQRVARLGTTFAVVDEVLADYFIQKRPSGKKARMWLESALRVLRSGYLGDNRIASNFEERPSARREKLLASEIYAACWILAFCEEDGSDLVELLSLLQKQEVRDLDPIMVAESIVDAQCIAQLTSTADDQDFWRGASDRARRIVDALEELGKVSRLGLSVAHAWERKVILANGGVRLFRLGASYAAAIDASQDIKPIQVPDGVDRVYCHVSYSGMLLGPIELPVFDGLVSPYVLEDTIAAEFAWRILGRFFDQNLYGSLEQSSDGTNCWSRNGCVLARGIERGDSAFHDTVGWAVFLQELWNRPSWTGDQFYEGGEKQQVDEPIHCGSNLTVEVSDEVRGVICDAPELELSVEVGRTSLGALRVSVGDDGLSEKALISTICLYGAMELCTLVVRQALIGQPAVGTPLRRRLAERAQRLRTKPDPTGLPSDNPILSIGRSALADAVTPDDACVFIPRHHGPLGTSVSRRAELPGSMLDEVVTSCVSSRLTLVRSNAPSSRMRIFYAPDLVQRTDVTSGVVTELREPANDSLFGRGYWEGLFARKPDPWRYGNGYEQEKYDRTLSLVPKSVFKALELACAEGFFTEKLAPRVSQLLATDISRIAVERTARRCSEFENVTYQCMDLIGDELPKDLDLIVCSEMLYYMGDWPTLTMVSQKLSSALKPGGYLLTAHANLIIDEPEKPGFDWQLPFGAKAIGDSLLANGTLRLRKEIRTPLYRIQLLQKTQEDGAGTEIIETELQGPLPDNIAAMARWGNSGPPAPVLSTQACTRRLPILMYHRVAPSGADLLARYRVHPDDFEQQICFLKEAGYYSATLDQWRVASESKRPLPGRAVILTFDDAYRDFQEFAWPVLKRYGFTAMVFVVTSQIGGVNEWDRAAEELDLMTAEEIQALDREGVVFGSHSHGHRSLLTLSPSEIAREHLVSRTTLERILGHGINSISYPFGANDRVVQHLAGACGFVFGVTTRFAACRPRDPLLELPRIEIAGNDGLEQFIAKLTNDD